MPLCAVQRFGGRLEGMAERPVADVVQQGGEQGDPLPFRVPPALAPRDDIGQPPRHVIDADAVGEAAVRCAGKHEVGEAELPDAAQALEFGRVQEVPGDPVRFVPLPVAAVPEHDQAVNRVADALRPGIIRRRHAPPPK